MVKLLVQPGDGIEPLLAAIKKAKQSVEMVIFRFDLSELEQAMVAAAERGVKVHTLIAFTNRGGEKNLRRLEMRFLAKGITVARTSDDLVRYHGKMVLIDRRQLHLQAYNFTHLDIEQSRSFGLVTTNRPLVQEAGKLFDCDTQRQVYSAGCARFVVSPANARQRLGEFLERARKQLLIYDVEIADRAMLHLIEERIKAGVEVRVLGEVGGKHPGIAARELARLRLHTRAMVRDGQELFLGSQSLRPLELDARREIGVIVHDGKMAGAVARVFEDDWQASAPAPEDIALDGDSEKTLKKMAKVIGKNLPPAPTLAKAIREAIEEQTHGPVDKSDVEEAVRGAVKEAVRDAVKHVVSIVVTEEIGQEIGGAKAG